MKKSNIYLMILALFFTASSSGQTEEKDLYNVRWAYEAPLTGAMAAFTYYNFRQLDSDKNERLDEATVLALDENDVAGWNRIGINPYQEKYSTYSDILFHGAFPYGFLLFLDKGIRQEWGDITLMYLETLGIAGVSYSTAALHVTKIRPYSYHPETGMGRRTGRGAKNSFYGGHPSLTAATTFFVAKVYGDYYPDRNFKYALYGIAGTATLANAYLRLKGGFHFTSDLLIGMAWGTAVGILVPELHKWRNGGSLGIIPVAGEYYGLGLNYKFK